MVSSAWTRGALVGGCLLALGACGDATTAPDVASVEVNAARTVLSVGEHLALSATVRDQEGHAVDALPVTWSSADASVLQVDGSGRVTALAPGTARVEAMSGGRSGGLVLSVTLPPCDASSVEGPVTPGATVTGSLGPMDCRLYASGPRADGFEIELDGPTALEVVMTSPDFDAVAAITGPDMTLHSFDDDGAGGSDARLFTVLPAGRWFVWASSFEAGGTGAYGLTVEVTPVEPCAEPVGTLAVGDAVSGVLDASSCHSELVGLTAPWRFEPAGTVTVRFDLASDDFDGLLVVTDEQDEPVAFDDDGGPGLDSRLVVTLDAGAYTVYAASFEGRGRGSYDLSVTAAGEAPPGAAGSGDAPAPKGPAAGWWRPPRVAQDLAVQHAPEGPGHGPGGTP